MQDRGLREAASLARLAMPTDADVSAAEAAERARVERQRMRDALRATTTQPQGAQRPLASGGSGGGDTAAAAASARSTRTTRSSCSFNSNSVVGGRQEEAVLLAAKPIIRPKQVPRLSLGALTAAEAPRGAGSGVAAASISASTQRHLAAGALGSRDLRALDALLTARLDRSAREAAASAVAASTLNLTQGDEGAIGASSGSGSARSERLRSGAAAAAPIRGAAPRSAGPLSPPAALTARRAAAQLGAAPRVAEYTLTPRSARSRGSGCASATR